MKKEKHEKPEKIDRKERHERREKQEIIIPDEEVNDVPPADAPNDENVSKITTETDDGPTWEII
jgi:hypothetical protein